MLLERFDLLGLTCVLSQEGCVRSVNISCCFDASIRVLGLQVPLGKTVISLDGR